MTHPTELYPFDIDEAKLALNNSDATNSEIALQFIRNYRNQLLTKSDWMANSDVTMTQEWRVYRQALRDLPANSTPNLDENGQLTGVTWPEKPE